MLKSRPHSTHLMLLLAILVAVPLTSAAGIIQRLFGYPSECMHRNIVMPCKLSFSCWLSGGMHVSGCGDNQWLFSCCVAELKTGSGAVAVKSTTSITTIPVSMPLTIVKNSRPKIKLKVKQPSVLAPPTINKNQILKRRGSDEGAFVSACGIQPNAQNVLQKRIIGGRQAQFAEYPWQAHIRISEFQCGGVLVSRRFVATAAHCIQQANIKDITVYLGELDTQNSGSVSEPLPAEKHRISKKVIHPLFQFRMTQPDRFDIALLKLTRPAGYRSHILPICLPTKPLSLTNKSATIAGWGKTEANMGHTGTNILRTASVPIISTKDCIRWHESKQINVELFGEMICAGHQDGSQDACLGDSGGPLIAKIKDRFTLIGITSAGFGCGVDHQPGIYHNVQLTTKWIQDVIKETF